MWPLATGVDAVSGGASGGNLYSLLIVLAGLLLGSGGLLRRRTRRRNPEVDPEPVARTIVDGTEPLLRARVRQLERAAVASERRERAMQQRVELLVGQLAACEAVRAQLEHRMNDGD